MRNNDTGEFELVVGNRQLLSGFFIVVLLFAVAFAMGYIFGQNSPRSARVQADGSSAPAAPAETRPPAASPVPIPEAPPVNSVDSQSAEGAAGASAGAQESAPQPTTQPARESPAAAPAPAPQPRAVAPAQAPQPARTVAAAPPVSTEAAPGTFWQVVALSPTEAEVVAKALKDKGFPASTSPGPNNLVRVLVGPYKDTQSMGRAKTQLESAGFHPIRK